MNLCVSTLYKRFKNASMLLQCFKMSSQPPNKKPQSPRNWSETRKWLKKKLFDEYLILTNTLTAGTLMGLGDIFQQEIEFQQEKLKERYNYARLGRLFVVGIIQGPFQHFFYKTLDKYLPRTDARTIVKKILLDQIIASPICIGTFFVGSGLLELRPLSECLHELKSKFVQVYITDWQFWPVIQIINFKYVPQNYRVLFICALTVVYDIFLSSVKHQDTHSF